ncbi:hypothetical protein PIB30_069508 [Stylosanthes scabra]|uniref:ATP-dependent DNA ligase family profile domain-containing protein n=1 Tax=Stylosanthes scabra TaxID=79078 RepID=A0ABU6WNX1_9FABA|nr:hypothetical protein [Stylosanthes scabra]
MSQELKAKPQNFKPSSVASWENGTPVPFSLLASALDMIYKESGRIGRTYIAYNLMQTVIYSTPEDLLPLMYLLGMKKNVCCLQELRDLGLVAKKCRPLQPIFGRQLEPLTIRKVFNTFRDIAKKSGEASLRKKRDHIKELLVAGNDCERQYLIRLLQRKLRIGIADQTLLAALAQAAVYTEEHSKAPADIKSPVEEAVKIVKQAYSVVPVYDKIVSALLTHGVWKLPSTCNFTPDKYDGERAQIHYMENGSVEIYSRNAERNTVKYPDVVAAISRVKKSTVSSFVLDCEIVGYDREKQMIRSFQELSGRPRKNVSMDNIKHLYASFEEEAGVFQYATAITTNDIEEIQEFLDQAVASSSEGLIIKTLDKDSTYEPSNRSNNWLKLKKDYLNNIGDSLDLLPIAAFHGRGKRTDVYGAFLVACYDCNNEEFQSICKIGTGFTEKDLKQCFTSLSSKVIPGPKSYYRYGNKMKPDVWFEASEVWEVKASDLTISPVHRAAVGIVDSDKGISLRFPRFIRVRPDKKPEEASSSE